MLKKAVRDEQAQRKVIEVRNIELLANIKYRAFSTMSRYCALANQLSWRNG